MKINQRDCKGFRNLINTGRQEGKVEARKEGDIHPAAHENAAAAKHGKYAKQAK